MVVVGVKKMTLIELTSPTYNEKFYLQAELIERIYERSGNTSEIRLTTGKVAVCLESPDKVKKLVDNAMVGKE